MPESPFMNDLLAHNNEDATDAAVAATGASEMEDETVMADAYENQIGEAEK